MRKLGILILASLAVLAIVSCASAPEDGVASTKQADMSNMPDWVVNMEVSEDAIYGIGYAKMSNLNSSRTTAIARARTDVSFQIQSTIQAMMTDYQQEAGVDGGSQVINFVENVSKQITNNELSGLTPDKMTVMEDGGVWVRVVYKKSEFIDDARQAFQRNEDAAFAEFKASQALERLNYELDNNPPQSDPVTD